MKIDKNLFEELFVKAKNTERLRINYDLRTSSADASQRMLNALLPGTEVSIHRHPNSTEDVLCLCGCIDEILYDEYGKESKCIHLCPREGSYGCVVPAGVWHSVEVYEPSVIYEGKDGKYGEDGSEMFDGNKSIAKDRTTESSESPSTVKNSQGNLKKNKE